MTGAKPELRMKKKAAEGLTPEQYAARFKAERQKHARDYCNAFKFWRTCAFKPCRRARLCSGDPTACLQRREAEVPREVQWQTRQNFLQALGADAGAPERAARELLPAALCEGER